MMQKAPCRATWIINPPSHDSPYCPNTDPYSDQSLNNLILLNSVLCKIATGLTLFNDNKLKVNYYMYDMIPYMYKVSYHKRVHLKMIITLISAVRATRVRCMGECIPSNFCFNLPWQAW